MSKQTDSSKNRRGPTWNGYYPRIERDKHQREDALRKKHKDKAKWREDDYREWDDR